VRNHLIKGHSAGFADRPETTTDVSSSQERGAPRRRELCPVIAHHPMPLLMSADCAVEEASGESRVDFPGRDVESQELPGV
jgi:hypothetical protein